MLAHKCWRKLGGRVLVQWTGRHQTTGHTDSPEQVKPSDWLKVGSWNNQWDSQLVQCAKPIDHRLRLETYLLVIRANSGIF